MAFYNVNNVEAPASLVNQNALITEFDGENLSVWDGNAWVEFVNKSYVDNAVANAPSGGEAFPVGSIFLSVVDTDPAVLLGYGTWSAFGAGKMLVGLNGADADIDTIGKTGGAKTHTLTTAEMPSHTHVQDAHNHTQNAHGHSITDPGHTHGQGIRNSGTAGTAGTQGASTANNANAGTTASGTTGISVANSTATNQAATATNQSTGGGGAHNNMPPYIVVRMWERTA